MTANKTHKFAHLADCHLGAQKVPELKKLEIKAFKECLDICVEEKVDFIIIAGDLFHSTLPDMKIVKEAIGKLKEVKDKGIPVYINYGSHDFSPTGTSIIDIITETGLLKKLYLWEDFIDKKGNQKLKLKFTIDKKTNAKLTGIFGRKSGIEEHHFEDLDLESLESEPGFKIFVFHTGIEEMLPSFLSKMDKIKHSYLPKGFDYYAGGHIHKRVKINPEEYGPMVYPGPLFAGYPRDLEISAKGEKRGFCIVEFDEIVQNCSFYELDLVKYEYIPPFIADRKNAYQLCDEIIDEIDSRDVDGKIVIMKVKGQLSSGKTSDINFKRMKEILKEKGAIYVNINHHALDSKEFSNITYKGESDEEIEENLLRKNRVNVNVETNDLKNENGTQLAIRLIRILRHGSNPNEKKIDYNNRILKDSLKVLNLEERK